MDSKRFTEEVCKVLVDNKAEDVVSIDVKEKSGVADYFVIAGGRSMTHTRALIEHVDEEMEKLWASGEWNEKTIQELKTAHYRTPYHQ